LASFNSKEGGEVLIPSNIFVDRSISVLEAVTEYLKEQRNMSYHEIGILLNRDERTIWTCYNRTLKKRGVKK
jgi:hypothetical protein